MPVPIVAPTPNSVSWNSPIERASSPAAGVGPGLGGHLADGLASQDLVQQRPATRAGNRRHLTT